MKEIKDYLHLYLGCDIQCPVSHSPETNGVDKLDAAFLQAIEIYPFDADRCKPILRPLSDMTEDEAIELAKLSEWEPHFRDVKVERNEFKDLIVSWDGMVEGGETFNATGELFYCAEQYQWLLSNHFDLFGLIESGLAIDKSNKTIKT